MTYLTINEAAARWDISVRRIQQMCKTGDIEGAIKRGRTWMVPDNASIEPKRSRNNKAFLPLPVGISSYAEAVSRYYYVDKTLLIKEFIDTLPKVSLFTRPRRFGKTLNMDMLRVFFEKTDRDTSVYFKDKNIWRCGTDYRSFQGKYPVIYLSFKDVKFAKWTDAFKDIRADIAAEYARHPELSDSVRCNSIEKQFFDKMISGTADEVEMGRSLSTLSAMLHKHHGTETVIIIDEYDTPIQQGYMNGYYTEVVGFIRNLFSNAFKDNKDLAYGFLTGILRVAKESIFSGMNNLTVNSVTDEKYSEYFGFTHTEVKEMALYYKASDKYQELCEWYDGYRFGSTEIFNPWSVINYFYNECRPKAFWQSTGSNEVIGEILSIVTPDITENLRRLLQGETVTTYIDTDVIYPRVKQNPSSIYSFLTVTGYLKISEIVPQDDGNFICKVSIPNKEIAFVYSKEVISSLNPTQTESTATSIREAVFEKNGPLLQKYLERYLIQTISYFDASDEAFYQGLMIGLCAILNNCYVVKSNRESGLGRFDIQLIPIDKQLPGFIFELKTTKNKSDLLEKLAEEALRQIEEKQYAFDMKESGVSEVIMIGIAFRGKEVAVKTCDCN